MEVFTTFIGKILLQYLSSRRSPSMRGNCVYLWSFTFPISDRMTPVTRGNISNLFFSLWVVNEFFNYYVCTYFPLGQAQTIEHVFKSHCNRQRGKNERRNERTSCRLKISLPYSNRVVQDIFWLNLIFYINNNFFIYLTLQNTIFLQVVIVIVIG